MSNSIIEKSFKQCGIFCALDGSENRKYHASLSLAFNPPEVTNDEFYDLVFNRDFDRFSLIDEE